MTVCFAVVQGETGEVYNIGTEKERTVKEVRQCLLLVANEAAVLCRSWTVDCLSGQ
mgnify:CR=1 FL=1